MHTQVEITRNERREREVKRRKEIKREERNLRHWCMDYLQVSGSAWDMVEQHEVIGCGRAYHVDPL